MKHLIKIQARLFVPVFVLFIVFSQAIPSTVTAQTHTAKYVSMNSNTKAYYEYLPKGYSSSKAYPVLIYVHGVAELGPGTAATITKVLVNGPPYWIKKGGFPTSFTVNGVAQQMIIISPQFIKNPSGSDITAVIDYLKSHYKIDASRIYLTGISMGGATVWNYASTNATTAKTVAAIIPICASVAASKARAQIMAEADLPVWGIHNEFDGVVPASYTVNWVNYINASTPIPSPLAKKTIFPVTGHNAWYKTYNPAYREGGKNLYEWLLSYKRGTSTTPANVAPVANAGADKNITLPTSSVTLAGSGTDSDGSISKYAWLKTAGPTQYSFSSTSVSNPVVSKLVAGTYTFRLTVTDNKGATAYNDMNVVVNNATPANVAPVANAGADKNITLPTSSVTLAGSGTDADGSISKYAWSKTAGPTQYSFSSTSVTNPVVSKLVAGTYTFRLTVTDNKGATAYNDMNVVVKSAAQAPIPVKPIPGKVEAELYDAMTGIQQTATTDAGGGNCVGYINNGDWFEYKTNVATAGTYTVSFRVSAPAAGGQFVLRNAAGTTLATVTVPNTGNNQTWTTVSAAVTLPAGSQTLRVVSTSASSWNINWMQFSLRNSKKIPGKIEAESYDAMYGVQKAGTTDAGGGNCVGYIAKGDWMDYKVYTAAAGSYIVSFRVSSLNTGGQFSFTRADGTVLATITVPNTGANQTWATVKATVTLPAGNETLRILSKTTGANNSSAWNINWIEFAQNTATSSTVAAETISIMEGGAEAAENLSGENALAGRASLKIYPNPVVNTLSLQLDNSHTGDMKVQVIDIMGRVRSQYSTAKNQQVAQLNLPATSLAAGTYFVRVQIGNWTETKKIVKL